jgi:hypothetical protein
MIIYVSIEEHVLRVVVGSRVISRYEISTGYMPPSNIENSRGTPLGWHKVIEKYGNMLEVGTVLIGRKSTGKNYTEFSDWKERGYVVTRILRLKGLQEGVNSGMTAEGLCCDTFRRYIYIHGTCFEEKIGTQNSNGCITMRNDDVIELHDICKIGTYVYIS